MWWMVSVLLLTVLGHALAQEGPAGNERIGMDDTARAYDRALARFNTDVQDFPSWEAFEGAILARIAPGTLGTCYVHDGGEVLMTLEPLPQADRDVPWRQTAGNGWQQARQDRTTIEYRFNARASTVVWIERVNPRLFFAYTRKMCEVSREGTLRTAK